MHLDELEIEITRRCNAKCQHCLRGAPQRKDIDNKTIDKLLEGITSIGVVTFTGGEPSLAVDRIRYIYEAISKRGISLEGFYIVTNGKKASIDLVHVLIDLYAYLDDYSKEECYTSGLVISGDQYHTDPSSGIDSTLEARNLYSALKFFRSKEREGDINSLIKEGRAKDIGDREAYLNEIIIGTDNDDKPVSASGTVYVNVNGDVITSCDLSFKSQENHKIGNVYDRTLPEILVAFASVDESIAA